MAPALPVPGQWSRSRRGRVRTRCTGVAPEPVGQALFECCVPAVRITVAIAVYIHAPGTILRLSGPCHADGNCESTHDDKQKSHGRLLVARYHECHTFMLLFPACAEDEARRIAVKATGITWPLIGLVNPPPTSPNA